MNKLKLKRNDQVVVIKGKDSGKEGKILKVFPEENKALVSDVNIVKKHQKQSAQSAGGIISKESKINISNIAFKDPKTGKPTRIGFKIENGKKVRFAKKSGEVIDN